MKRDPNALTNKTYDVLIIGGGVYGLFAAWDTAMRGLSVGLVEKSDFGHATSSNSLRVIHGGLRYLQSADIRRMRISIRERSTFMRIAPHLVHPLPFVIPTYGMGMRGKLALSLAVKIHDLVGFDRNRDNEPQKALPSSRTMTKRECIGLFPGLEQRGLTGAATYFDCQMLNSERLILDVLRSAHDAGAELANYVEAKGFDIQDDRIRGVSAVDTLTGDELEIRARMVLNCGGPWMDDVLRLPNGYLPERWNPLSKAFNLLVARQFAEKHAFGFYSKATSTKGSRMFFVLPWEDMSIIGTEHLPYHGKPDDFEVTDDEVQAFLGEVNDAYSGADLQRSDVVRVFSGLLPADGVTGSEVALKKHYRIVDHGKSQGLQGLVSVCGVKFTEARYVAEKCVDLISRKLNKSDVRSSTALTPMHGGDTGHLDEFVARAHRDRIGGLLSHEVDYLISRYGSAYTEVGQYIDAESLPSADGLDAHRILKAEVLYGIRHEMAQKLVDVVDRRTSVGIGFDADDEHIRYCAALMAEEMGWDESKTARELDETKRYLSGLMPCIANARERVSI